jgi:hypothetical protein
MDPPSEEAFTRDEAAKEVIADILLARHSCGEGNRRQELLNKELGPIAEAVRVEPGSGHAASVV